MTKRLFTLGILALTLVLSGCAELETVLEDMTESTQTSQEDADSSYDADLLDDLDEDDYYSSYVVESYLGKSGYE